MHIQFDSKNKDEVLAAKIALDYLLLRHEAKEKIKLEQAPPEVVPPPPENPNTENVTYLPNPKPKKEFIPRKRENVVFEAPTNATERKKYPGLYKLAIMTYEWMQPDKLYALSEIQEYMVHIGHPKSSASGVMHAMINKGYAQRPMKALYKRVTK